jgi:two-component system OmpR family sensor kinase
MPKAHAHAPSRPPVASFRLRILFRGAFLLLAVATIALAVVLLRDEKERSYRNYQQALRQTHAAVLEQLRQPAGMLALLNAQARPGPPLTPLVLPYPALDFDEQNSVHHLVDQAGCAVRYPDGGTLCVGVGGAPRATGYLYVVGSFLAQDLVGWDAGSAELAAAHRVRIRVETSEGPQSWSAPFEIRPLPDEPVVRGRILGFEASGAALPAQASRDFRGTLWQSTRCASGAPPDCRRRVFYAMRLPVKAWRDRAQARQKEAWPPADLAQARVHLAVLPPGDAAPLFDSDAPGAQAGASLETTVRSLRPGEVLTISRQDLPAATLVLKGREPEAERGAPWLLRLVGNLPVTERAARIELSESLATPVGSYEIQLDGDPRAIEPALGAIATRVSWYVSAMLAALVLAWLVIELGVMRRIVALSHRAAAVSQGVRKEARGGDRIGALEVSDLRGPDELGVLAGGLADLLQRVKDDVEREELRARQEREMLEAVGHEILSPLQSLMVLFPDPAQPAHRYVQRMRQAVGALYGQSSPREALKAAQLELVPLDFEEFLFHVASNAEFAGIADVRYTRFGRPVMVQADEFSLEDVVTHILRNADRHREPGTPIGLSLAVRANRAVLRIHNTGAPVSEALLERMFDYGARDEDGAESPGRRGQGLFVARTYLAKMGGSIGARNEEGGVAFFIELPVVRAA